MPNRSPRHPLDVLARLLVAAPFGEREFAERVLHRNPTAVARWFEGRPIPQNMVRLLFALKRVTVVGDELHVVYRYAAPVKRSEHQRRLLKARAAARKYWRHCLPGGEAPALRESEQAAPVAAARKGNPAG